jgi:cobalamin biosynthesis protein CobT
MPEELNGDNLPSRLEQTLPFYAQARAALAQAHSVDEAKNIRDKTEAARVTRFRPMIMSWNHGRRRSV